MADALKTRKSDSLNQTTSTSLTAAGMGAFLLWIFGMIDAGRFFVPPAETAIFMGAGLLPIIQAIAQRWIREINHDLPPARGINGGAPAPLEEVQP